MTSWLSYTNYLVDLSGSMSFGLAIFGAIKMVQSLDNSWSRAKPGFRRVSNEKDKGTLVIIGYRDSQLNKARAGKLQKALEAIVGMPKVICIDDLFGGESFIRSSCTDYSCQMAMVQPAQLSAVHALLSQRQYTDILYIDEHVLDIVWDPDEASFGKAISPKLLVNCALVLESYSLP